MRADGVAKQLITISRQQVADRKAANLLYSERSRVGKEREVSPERGVDRSRPGPGGVPG